MKERFPSKYITATFYVETKQNFADFENKLKLHD